MDQKAFDDLQTRFTALEAEHKTMSDQHKALDGRYKAIEEALTEAKAQVITLTTEKYSKQLDELIGKKIAPAEKESLLKMAEVSEEVFLEHLEAVKARPDMKLIDGAGIKHDAPTTKLLPEGADSGVSGGDFASFVSGAAGIR